ncbi:protein spaetzle 4 [Diorhabda carinulata]|uniref:protein spaetzle 4 n=1 Tax=Diorhabda carinulata TaxID=1163345 RepID=UPI0025A2F1F3|nr:protein spaetzle 4 [Diorhabda carinulata]
MILCCFVLLLYARRSLEYGYDAGGDQATCGRPYRSGKMFRPPCDLLKQGYCTSAGKTYPWQAVRRFVKDNQGLMRRMYGDQRHGHVLRTEFQDEPEILTPIENNLRYSRYNFEGVENEYNEVESEARFLRDDLSNDDVLNTKFIYSEEPIISIKLAGLKTAPHFRQSTDRTTKSTPTKKTEDFTTTENYSDNPDVTTTTESSFESTTYMMNETREDSTVTTTTGTNEEVTAGEKSDEKEKMAETMLFQDLDNEDSKKKVHVNYNMKGVNACPVREEVVAPFWANNTRGEVLALLNMYPFEQYVHWEKCTYEHRQMYCRDGCRCEQQYRLHRLLAYDPSNECRGIFSDWFKFPSCCVCKCYDMPVEFRVTSRSPRYQTGN